MYAQHHQRRRHYSLKPCKFSPTPLNYFHEHAVTTSRRTETKALLLWIWCEDAPPVFEGGDDMLSHTKMISCRQEPLFGASQGHNTLKQTQEEEPM
jgi:hypothetical protein